MPSVDFRLYLVTDRRQTKGRALRDVLARAMAAGLPAVQLRERDLDTVSLLSLARDVKDLARVSGTRLLINDRADVAMLLDAGVHLRSDSLPISAARRVMAGGSMVACSAHSVDEAARAEQEGADFVVLGPIYDTPSKRAYGPPLGLGALEAASQRVHIPIFAIGGVTAERAREVRRAGAFGAAVVSAILSAEDVAASTRALLDAVR